MFWYEICENFPAARAKKDRKEQKTLILEIGTFFCTYDPENLKRIKKHCCGISREKVSKKACPSGGTSSFCCRKLGYCFPNRSLNLNSTLLYDMDDIGSESVEIP